MTRRGNFLGGTFVFLLLAGLFVSTWSEIIKHSIHLDLGMIGKSIYEARQRDGRWPASLQDLEGTEYLSWPHRRNLLEKQGYVVLWHPDLDPDPAANADRILAYDNSTILTRFGRFWVCRGDLTLECLRTDELQALLQCDGK